MSDVYTFSNAEYQEMLTLAMARAMRRASAVANRVRRAVPPTTGDDRARARFVILAAFDVYLTGALLQRDALTLPPMRELTDILDEFADKCRQVDP